MISHTRDHKSHLYLGLVHLRKLSQTMDSPLILPICTVQPDFDVSVRDVDEGLVPEEKFWLSWYKSGEESVHGQVSVSLNENDRSLLEYNGLKGVAFNAGSEVSGVWWMARWVDD